MGKIKVSQSLISFLFILLFCSESFANTKDSLRYWLETSAIENSTGTEVLSLDTVLLNKILKISRIEKDMDALARAEHAYGLFYNLESQPLIALKHFQACLEIQKRENLDLSESRTLESIAQSLHKLGRFQEAIETNTEALELLEKEKEIKPIKNIEVRRLNILNALGTSYSRINELEKALIFFQEVYDQSLKIADDFPYILNLARTNMGYIYLELNNPNKAFKFLSEYHETVVQEGDPNSLAKSFGNLAYCEYLLNNFDKAYYYYNESLTISESQNFPYTTFVTYKDLSDTYFVDGKLALSIKYLKKHHHLRDSLQGTEIQAKVSSLKVEHQTELQQQEILKLEQQNRIQRQRLFITIGGMIIIGLLGILISAYLYQMNRRRKEQAKFHKEQAKLKEEQNRQREELQALKLNNLNQELNHKKQDITRLVMAISQKQEFSNELLEQLDSLKQYLNPNASKAIRNIKTTIRERLQSNEEQMIFYDNIEKINQAFYDKLKSDFPSLSKSEQDLCSFIRLGLTNKEIAAIRIVSPEAIRMGKFRLRKKLSLVSNQDVEQFLQTL